MLSLCANAREGFGITMLCFVGVNSRCCGKQGWVLFCQGDGAVARIGSGAGDEHMHKTGGTGAIKHCVQVCCK